METEMETAVTSVMTELCADGRIWEALDGYLEQCRAEVQTDLLGSRKRAVLRFPNLAGFCRYLRVGMSELKALREQCFDIYDRLLAIFEDEALNSALSPTLLTSYMKKRLSFGDADGALDRKEVTYCFEHDILADGE